MRRLLSGHEPRTRRAAVAVAGLLLTGCTGVPDAGAGGNGTATNPTDGANATTGTDGATGTDVVTGTTAMESATSTTTADGSTTSSETEAGELDLREANVVGVAVGQASDGYRFDVTLYHDVHESRALVSQPERFAFW
jgi:hypothetical protein